MESVSLEELQGSSSEHTHEVHSPCRVPFELQLWSTPHHFLYRMTRGVPQERHSGRTRLEELLINSVGIAPQEFRPTSVERGFLGL